MGVQEVPLVPDPDIFRGPAINVGTMLPVVFFSPTKSENFPKEGS